MSLEPAKASSAFQKLDVLMKNTTTVSAPFGNMFFIGFNFLFNQQSCTKVQTKSRMSCNSTFENMRHAMFLAFNDIIA